MSFLLAQAQGTEAAAGLITAFISLCCTLIPMVAAIAGMWKVFDKAGKPGWAAIIPFYNLWVLVEISGKDQVMWFILALIPMINLIAMIIISIGVAEQFGKDTLYGVGLGLVPFVFYPVLGFSDAQYRGQTGGGPPGGGQPGGGQPGDGMGGM